jgi:hypothetical protein
VGEYKTEQVARGAAMAKAMEFVSQPSISPTLTVHKRMASFKTGDV